MLTDVTTDPQFEHNLSLAIEIMTAQFSDTSDKSFASERLQRITDDEGQAGLMGAFAGVINLAGLAIDELSRQTNVPALELLQRLALNARRET
jgi:hypothetical protein